MLEKSSGPEKTYDEGKCFQDALEMLGISFVVPEIDIRNTPSVIFPWLSSEEISLAHATRKALEGMGMEDSSFHIVLQDGNTSYLLTKKGLSPVRIKENPSMTFPDERVSLGSDAYGFSKYTSNKLLAGMILRKRGILTPREIALRDSPYFQCERSQNIQETIKSICIKQHKKVMQFLEGLGGKGDKFVVKPYDQQQGTGVYIMDKEDFSKNNQGGQIFPEDTQSRVILVQEKIQPYKLMINGKRKDWNVRVLVTYDTEKNSYVSSGIVARVADADTPVNISINASYHTFEEVISMTDIDPWLHPEIEWILKNIAESSVKAISDYAVRKSKNPMGNRDFQVLAGVDIIFDEDMRPVVVEVNDARSGCNYELMKLQGIEALYPIGRAIITKTLLRKRIIDIVSKAIKLLTPQQMEKYKDGKLVIVPMASGDAQIITTIIEELAEN